MPRKSKQKAPPKQVHLLPELAVKTPPEAKVHWSVTSHEGLEQGVYIDIDVKEDGSMQGSISAPVREVGNRTEKRVENQQILATVLARREVRRNTDGYRRFSDNFSPYAVAATKLMTGFADLKAHDMYNARQGISERSDALTVMEDLESAARLPNPIFQDEEGAYESILPLSIAAGFQSTSLRKWIKKLDEEASDLSNKLLEQENDINAPPVTLKDAQTLQNLDALTDVASDLLTIQNVLETERRPHQDVNNAANLMEHTVKSAIRKMKQAKERQQDRNKRQDSRKQVEADQKAAAKAAEKAGGAPGKGTSKEEQKLRNQNAQHALQQTIQHSRNRLGSPEIIEAFSEKYQPTGRPQRMDALEVIDPTSMPIWGTAILAQPPLRKKVEVYHMGRGIRRPHDEGTIPVNMHRYATDRRIFRATGKYRGGSVLIDASGSMSLTDEQIEEIIHAASASIIATYSGGNLTQVVNAIMEEPEAWGVPREAFSPQALREVHFGRWFTSDQITKAYAAASFKYDATPPKDMTDPWYERHYAVWLYDVLAHLDLVARNRASYQIGILKIIAKDGYRLQTVDDKKHKGATLFNPVGGNVIDMPALQWLAKQKAGLKLWVSDAHAIPASGDTRLGQIEAAVYAQTRQITRVLDAHQAIKAVKKYVR